MNKSWKVVLAFAGIFVAGGVTGGLMALRVANANASSGVVEPPLTVSTPTPQPVPAVAPTVVTAQPTTAQPAPVRQGGNTFIPPEQLGPQLFRRLTNQLGLSPEQRVKIRPIEMRATEEINRVRRESVHTTQELIDKNEDEIRAELTPEQMAKFDALVGQQRQKIKKFVANQQKRQREMRRQMFQPAAAGNVIASPATTTGGDAKK